MLTSKNFNKKHANIKKILDQASASLTNDSDVDTVLSDVSEKLSPYFDPGQSLSQEKSKKSFFDRTLIKLLAMIRSSTSKDGLIKELFSTLQANQKRLSADYILDLKAFSNKDQVAHLEVSRVLGAHEHQVANFRGSFANRINSLGVLSENAFLDGTPTEFMLIDPASDTAGLYNDEFREIVGSRAFWLCIMPLPRTHTAEPSRAIALIYMAKRQLFEYQFPRGAIAEWQIIETLPSLYSVIDFQLGTLAEQVAAQRRNLIMELAPQAINHEITNQLGIIGDVRKRIGNKLVELGKALEASPRQFLGIRDELYRLRAATIKARRSTEAFSNMERRSRANRMLLADLFDEIEVLLDYKLENKDISFDYSLIPEIYIETDTTMVEHVLLNIVSNAIDAFPNLTSQLDNRKILVDAALEGDGFVNVVIGNNGPPIKASIRNTLFQKGTTTKGRGEGHGQGLYICRLVANFLNGEFGYGKMKIDGDNAPVAFSFKFPQQAEGTEELMGSEIGVYDGR